MLEPPLTGSAAWMVQRWSERSVEKTSKRPRRPAQRIRTVWPNCERGEEDWNVCDAGRRETEGRKPSAARTRPARKA